MPQMRSVRAPSRLRKSRTMMASRPFFRLLWKSFALVSGLGVCSQGFLWFSQKGFLENHRFLPKQTGFKLQDVWVEGRAYTSLQALGQTIGLSRQDSLFQISPLILKERLEKLPWVKRVIVQRHFPSLLLIYLVERQPLALWQKAGKKKLLDTQGQVIPCAEQEYPPHLITVVGEEAPQATATLLEMLSSFPHFSPRIQAAVRLRSGRWDLYLKEKTVLKLPPHHETRAMQRFLEFEKRTLQTALIETIDLRFPDRLILQMHPKSKTTQRA